MRFLVVFAVIVFFIVSAIISIGSDHASKPTEDSSTRMTEDQFANSILTDQETKHTAQQLFSTSSVTIGAWEIRNSGSPGCGAMVALRFRGDFHPYPGVNVPEQIGMTLWVDQDPPPYTVHFNGAFNAKLTFVSALGRVVSDNDPTTKLTISRVQFEQMVSQSMNFYYESQSLPTIPAAGAGVVEAFDKCVVLYNHAEAEYKKYVHSRYLRYLAQ